MLTKIFELLRSFLILYVVLLLGEWVSQVISIGVPGSIWGLLILFFCLTLQIIKVNWIYMSARLLIRYMALLFIPVSVGVMTYGNLLLNNLTSIVLPNILSTFLVLIIISFSAEYAFNKGSFPHLRQKVKKRRSENLTNKNESTNDVGDK